MVKCQICKKKLKAITNTHLSIHNLTVKQYKRKYPKAHILSAKTKRIMEVVIAKATKAKTGVPRPDLSKSQSENNTMWSLKTRRKMSKTRRKKMDRGEISSKELMKRIGRNDGPTEAEQVAINNIAKLKIPLKFVGDAKFFVGRKCPDFINKKMKIAVELDQAGRKNNSDRQRERIKYFLKHGWRLFFFSKTDLESMKILCPLFEKPKWRKIRKIITTKQRQEIKVYNIECSPNNNYFADNILVHNCFALMSKSVNPSFSSKLHSINYKAFIAAIRRKKTTHRLEKMKEHFLSKRFVLHWGGLADPFCNFEKANNVGYKIISALAEEKYPTLFSFKGSAIFRPNFTKLFAKYAHQKNFAFQVSIVAPSDKMSRKIEVGAPVTSRRIKALKHLSSMGYFCILRLRPFIIGITDDGLEDLLHQAKEAGIKAVSMEYMAIDWRSAKTLRKRYKWIGDLIGTNDLQAYFKALSPSERGGYMRLNRLVKEASAKTVYKFCDKNDILFACSDPDYKELNQTGSCFSANTRILVKTKHSPFILKKSLLDLYQSNKNFSTEIKVLCDGVWKLAKPIRIKYDRNWFKITLRNGATMVVTNDHIHFTKDGEKITKNLRKGDFILFGNKPAPSKSKRGSFDLGRFIGLYVAEGCMALNESKRSNIYFTINKHRLETIKFIKEFSLLLGGYINTKKPKRDFDHHVDIRTYSKTIKAMMNEFVAGKLSKNKQLKPSVLNMSQEFREGVLTGWSEGDGGKRSNSNGSGSSASEQLTIDMYNLAISLGRLPSLHKYKRKTSIKTVNGKKINVKASDNSFLYNVGIHTKTDNIIGNIDREIKYSTDKIYRQKFHKIKGKIYTQITNIEIINCNRAKYAYCLEVPNGNRFQLMNGIITHNCCGLPHVYPENPEMQNWSRNQLTFHLKEARRKYHLDGITTKFKFDKVFDIKKQTFLQDSYFANDHISSSMKSASERSVLTYLSLARDIWNNLRSPGNPMNYFHGKLLPIRIDENENYVFKYCPSEYEDRWLKEGISLSNK